MLTTDASSQGASTQSGVGMTVCPDSENRSTELLISLFPYFLPPIRGGLRAWDVWAESTGAGWLRYRNSQLATHKSPTDHRVPHIFLINPTQRVSRIRQGPRFCPLALTRNRTRARLHFVQLLHLSTDLLTRCFHGSWGIHVPPTPTPPTQPNPTPNTHSLSDQHKMPIHRGANASRVFRGEIIRLFLCQNPFPC